jgi:hypothetical protein
MLGNGPAAVPPLPPPSQPVPTGAETVVHHPPSRGLLVMREGNSVFLGFDLFNSFIQPALLLLFFQLH